MRRGPATTAPVHSLARAPRSPYGQGERNPSETVSRNNGVRDRGWMATRAAVRVCGASAVAAVLLAACGSSSKSVRSAGTPTSAAPPATVAPSATTVPPTIQAAADPKLGQILVDAQHITLYLNTRERTGGTFTIACTGSCATTWPPLALAAGASPTAGPGVTGVVGTKTRPDGSA